MGLYERFMAAKKEQKFMASKKKKVTVKKPAPKGKKVVKASMRGGSDY